MEAVKFDYSMKNILVTIEIFYLLKLIGKIELVIKRMRWKVIYCDMKGNSIETKTYGLKSQKTLPPIDESAAFENDFFYFYLFFLFKIYLQLTVNRKKEKKKYLAYLKTMLIYVNFHKKNTDIYKRTIKLV